MVVPVTFTRDCRQGLVSGRQVTVLIKRESTTWIYWVHLDDGDHGPVRWVRTVSEEIEPILGVRRVISDAIAKTLCTPGELKSSR